MKNEYLETNKFFINLLDTFLRIVRENYILCIFVFFLGFLIPSPKVSEREIIQNQLKYFQNKHYILREDQRGEKFIIQSESEIVPELNMRLIFIRRMSDNMLFNVLTTVDARFKIGEEVSLLTFVSKKNFSGTQNECWIALPKN